MLGVAAPLLVVGVAWSILAHQHRAIAIQPLDYVKAISTEISKADSGSQGWRMVRVVSGMFWDSYEVRMVDGRAFSCLPFYRPLMTTTEETDITDVDDIHIDIVNPNE
jgi:hypothetical protein